MSTLDRFWSHVNRRAPSDCWLWQSAYGSHGYGAFRLGRRVLTASRALLILTGRLSVRSRRKAMHVCDVPGCVNPKHVQPATHRANMIDASRKGRLRRVR